MNRSKTNTLRSGCRARAPDAKSVYHLDAAYVDDGSAIVALQLHKAGLRLAKILNKALAKSS